MHDIFYFTDIHGCYDLYRAAMDYCFEQDPECTIIFGGDACDRGPDGYKIMKELLEHPQVGYLKGNHEDMFACAALKIESHYNEPLDFKHIDKYLLNCRTSDKVPTEISLALCNGGYPTLRDWMLDGMPHDIIRDLVCLRTTFSYGYLDFCHAGGDYKTFSKVVEAEDKDEWPEDKDEFFLLWDRVHLGQGWAPNRTCIFGHTATNELAAKYYGRDKSMKNIHPCAYNATLDDKWTGRKIAMDTCTAFSGKLYVLNILTMQAQGFLDTDVTNDEIHKHDIEKIDMIQF